jgi:hypothetical protein
MGMAFDAAQKPRAFDDESFDPIMDPETWPSRIVDGIRRWWRPDPVLDVVTAVFNPYLSRRRFELYEEFRRHMEEAGVRLTTVELAVNGDPFMVTSAGRPDHIQVRSKSCVWVKENLLNLGIASLPTESTHVAWVDCDITFHNPRWVEHTLARLRDHHFVQMYEWAYDRGPDGSLLETYRSFGAAHAQRELPSANTRWDAYCGWTNYSQDFPVSRWNQPGLAWAARRSSLLKVGGLYDYGIVGSGDSIMASALIGYGLRALRADSTDGFRETVSIWQVAAQKLKGSKLGFVPGKVSHHWHGDRRNRGYVDRDLILSQFHYDPLVDLDVNPDGVYEVVAPGLCEAIGAYFVSRDDDRA